jgi:hypothetical protein
MMSNKLTCVSFGAKNSLQQVPYIYIGWYGDTTNYNIPDFEKYAANMHQRGVSPKTNPYHVYTTIYRAENFISLSRLWPELSPMTTSEKSSRTAVHHVRQASPLLRHPASLLLMAAPIPPSI